MGVDLNCERTFDDELVYRVMTSPEIWQTVAEDGQNPDDFNPNCDDDCWLLIDDRSELVGLYNLHASNSTTLMMHAQIMTDKRQEYSDRAGLEVWKWILNNCPNNYQKFNAMIPTIYPNVKNYADRMFMVLEGLNRKSYLKNGNICDQWMMGVTRDEIKEFLANE